MRLAWQQIPSTTISELLCLTDLDGIVIDAEHGCFNNETLYNCIQLITSKDRKCLVRLTEVNKTLIRLCLDAGASGLIFSTVEDIDDAKLIRQLCKFPKFGGRRGLGLVRENKWGYGKLVNEPPIIIAQIETKKGIDNLKWISEQNFDFYMIGPYDLSASFGVAGDFEDEKYLAALKKVEEMIPEEKMAVHIPTDVKKQLKKYKNYGIIAVGMDTTAFLEKYMEIAKNA